MIKGIGHLGIAVENIEKSLDALAQVIDFERPPIKEFPEKNAMRAGGNEWHCP